MTAPGKIIFREIPTPQVEKGQFLVKVRMIGICGSDIHVYHGNGFLKKMTLYNLITIYLEEVQKISTNLF